MAQLVKNPPANAGDAREVSVLGLGRSPGEGNGNLLQYSCLENPMERGAWWATVHGITKSRTQLSMCVHACTYTHRHSEIGLLFSILFVLLIISRRKCWC